jgi:hypothetical protein
LFDAEAVRHGHHTIQKASQSNEIRRWSCWINTTSEKLLLFFSK